MPILVSRVEAACASGGLAFTHAVDAIQAGADICLVVGMPRHNSTINIFHFLYIYEHVHLLGAEVQNTVSAREGGDYLARASHYRSL